MKSTLSFIAGFVLSVAATAQVDTAFVYRTGLPYGTLDIRLSKSAQQFYYLQEGITVGFRESAPGIRTQTFADMTPWDSQAFAEGNLREKGTNFDQFVLNYRLLFPQGYAQQASDLYPLIVVLHGPGARGNCQGDNCYWSTREWRPAANLPPAPNAVNHPLLNNDDQLVATGEQHLTARNLAGTLLPGDPALPSGAFPGFVLYPQNLNAWNPDPCQDVIRLIRLVAKNYKVDPDRIYIEGLSDGGTGLYEVVKRAPWLFAAAVPMSATFDAGLISQGLASTLAPLPFRVFQGSNDFNPTPSRTTGYVNALRAAGVAVHYTQYANTGNNTWTQALAEADFFPWLLGNDQANIQVVSANKTVCLINPVPLTLAVHNGYHAYQWEHNGAVIGGATTHAWTTTVPGTYRVRFSRQRNPTETEWNRWSDPFVVAASSPATPLLAVSGTLLLPDLNNESKANLRVTGDYQHYFWYRNGVLLDLPGSADDTTQHVTITSMFGDGLYSARTAGEDGCQSVASNELQIYFNAQAPVNVATPGKFKGVATDSSIMLSWTDNAGNETGYELWRRQALSAPAFTPWKLIGVAPVNATSYADNGLDADVLYHYKIRGIHPQGRSYYNPSLGFQLEVQTFPDATLPVVPVDTLLVYNPDAPFGPLDIRIAKSALQYYYLRENVTESFRTTPGGERTNTFHDMTGWDSSPYQQGHLREKNGAADNFVMNYRLLFPAGYQPEYADGYPLIVMMHGAGERGNCWNADCYWADKTWSPLANIPAAPLQESHALMNNDHNLLHGGEVHLQARNLAGGLLPHDPSMPPRAFPGFVLFPQNLNGWTSDMAQDAVRLMRLILKKYNINPDRVYIHGLSDGGVGLYEVLKRAPWLFAAAAPMSSFNDAGLTALQLNHTVASIPFWIFQGGVDGDPAPATTEFYAQAFRQAGASVRYTVYPNLGHGVWNDAYNEPDFFAWLQQQDQSNIHVFAGDSAICGTNSQGALLSLPKGYLAYQWQHDGNLLSGATAATLVALDTGVYRARFSRLSRAPDENEWNGWSAPVRIREQHPAAPSIVASGTLHLPDMNNGGSVTLKAASSFARYQWYKNNALLDLPGNHDDTTRHLRITTAMGSGVYTLKTAGVENCMSAPSAGVHVFVNGASPQTIVTPSKLKAVPAVATVALTWNDNSDNENGFEIWRRQAIGSGVFSPWTLAALTPAHVTAVTDTSLLPLTVYHYKIRAVSNSARSYYFPSYGFQVEVTTLADTQPPSPPSSLAATPAGIQSIHLQWNPATDDSRIRQYYIYDGTDSIGTGTGVTSFTLHALPLNTVFDFVVRAEDVAGNLSEPSPVATANTFVSGLYYEHSTGAWTDLDQIAWEAPAEYSGTVSNFTLAPRRQEDFFNFEFDGFVYVPQEGTYQFSIASDDGSRLALDDSVIIDNDGLHGTINLPSAELYLAAGPHRINTKFFEHGGSAVLEVWYRGAVTSGAWMPLPDSMLRSGTPPTTGARQKEFGRYTALQNKEALMITLYPNPLPAGDELRIPIDNLGEQPVVVSIFNAAGTMRYTETFIVAGGEIAFRPGLPAGLYVVIAQQGARRFAIKLMAQ